jgi:hypothetical protein
MRQVENCIILGTNLPMTEEDYQFILNIHGVGQFRTIMTPEEYQVVNNVITRMLADGYFELTKKQFNDPPLQQLNVHRIEID